MKEKAEVEKQNNVSQHDKLKKEAIPGQPRMNGFT